MYPKFNQKIILFSFFGREVKKWSVTIENIFGLFCFLEDFSFLEMERAISQNTDSTTGSTGVNIMQFIHVGVTQGRSTVI